MYGDSSPKKLGWLFLDGENREMQIEGKNEVLRNSISLNEKGRRKQQENKPTSHVCHPLVFHPLGSIVLMLD